MSTGPILQLSKKKARVVFVAIAAVVRPFSRHARLSGHGAFVFLVALAAAPAPAAGETREINASAATVDKALQGKQTYNFVVVSANEFVDQEGRHFSPKAVKAYLDKVRPDKNAAYVFWIPNPSAVETVKAAIPVFDEYGAVMIVVREIDKAKKAVAQSASDATAPKTVVLVGQPNPQALSSSDRMPEMVGRPVHLRPGPLPRRVRYRFRTDAEVMAAAELVRATFLDGAATVNASSIAKVLAVQPGVWTKVAQLPALKDAKLTHAQIELAHRVATLDCGVLDKPAQAVAVVDQVRSMISADGGGVRRALRTDEMNEWWTYIGFDIEEPVFVVETNGGHHRFIVACSTNKISMLDDLNALPTE